MSIKDISIQIVASVSPMSHHVSASMEWECLINARDARVDFYADGDDRIRAIRDEQGYAVASQIIDLLPVIEGFESSLAAVDRVR